MYDTTHRVYVWIVVRRPPLLVVEKCGETDRAGGDKARR